jgi:hypothetical protein
MRPLGHRLEVIDRFGALDLDDASQLLVAREHEIGKERQRSELDRGGLIFAEVERHLELPLVLLLEMPDEAIVLELLSNGPDKDGGHETSGCLGRQPDNAQTAERTER